MGTSCWRYPAGARQAPHPWSPPSLLHYFGHPQLCCWIIPFWFCRKLKLLFLCRCLIPLLRIIYFSASALLSRTPMAFLARTADVERDYCPPTYWSSRPKTCAVPHGRLLHLTQPAPTSPCPLPCHSSRQRPPRLLVLAKQWSPPSSPTKHRD